MVSKVKAQLAAILESSDDGKEDKAPEAVVTNDGDGSKVSNQPESSKDGDASRMTVGARSSSHLYSLTQMRTNRTLYTENGNLRLQTRTLQSKMEYSLQR